MHDHDQNPCGTNCCIRRSSIPFFFFFIFFSFPAIIEPSPPSALCVLLDSSLSPLLSRGRDFMYSYWPRYSSLLCLFLDLLSAIRSLPTYLLSCP
ncbi:hypothetical protein P168DRAFT_112193 [Aspergillus campestris IBT 28561]|uniref:Uncharacterized protein n=1 Tax=Aspergillus campestris (strain IBT 28561) TaxID=1392248 RepID=A0A2I1D989_ASPC2|nr:uncharacterized protein P168DRAFT_112193 [Aspergillus campestris IBT 28561]PKY06451.1 hypothetical protein P168DRAFT_112193 [Aspergillus campestris IBT 28561]